MTLFSEHSVVFSETWPSSGMTRSGSAYPLPTSVPVTNDSGISSLLGTPRAADGMHHNLRTGVGNPRGRLEDQISLLLPTPQTVDTQPSGPADMRRDSPNLRAIRQLLPTPNAIDAAGGPKRIRQDGRTEADHGPQLRDLAVTLLPTPTTEPATGNGHARNLGKEIALLPTPTATPYGSNQSPSDGAAVRPSLDTLFSRAAAIESTSTSPTDASASDGTEAAAPARLTLFPTPRGSDAEKGGPNQRGSSGDLMLPSAVHRLLPTPTAMDSKASGGNSPSNVTLTDAIVRTLLGATTNPRFDAGNESSDDPPQLPLKPVPEADSDSPAGSTNG
jgi:hypothetical protein